jgi:CheY-like chemotaxis protein
VPATRLLVVADAKMLPALANGLRDGGKFDVLTIPLADAANAQAAAERADALALFYGAPDKSLPTALQALAPKVRERGGRVVAVLQRDQAAQRDECFRAGASDLLFMPMPKDQFLARLVASVGLSWAPEAGSPSPVSIATRTVTTKIEYAAVSPAGVEGPGDLPLKSGDTVRLTWGSFQAWGLVVRGGPSVQIRFAGLAPEEEATIRDWLKSGGQVAVPEAAAPAAAPVAPAPPAAAPLPTPPETKPAAPSAPASGPPPGFADRKPIRPHTATRPPVRMTPPTMTPGNGVAAAATAPPAPLPGLFEEAAAAAAAAPAPPSGPAWPNPALASAAKTATVQFLKDKTTPADTPPVLTAAAKKIAGMLSSGERAALEKAGPDSHLIDALAARIALDAATSEGVVLYGNKGMPAVDPTAVTAITQMADAAAARLQEEANTAIGNAQVEQLQMVTAASAALSRDVLTFKETADRLRGVGAAPRLGAGGLDPEMLLPGQQPRPKSTAPGAAAPVRAELRDFRDFEGSRGAGKKVVLALAVAAFIASLTYALFFVLPRSTEISAEAAGPNVVSIQVSGPSALVVVNQAWVDNAQREVGKLMEVLRSRGVEAAILKLPSGASAGQLDVKNFKLVLRKSPPAETK